jgi:uncharacterized beta-barrel protein YwiB (DUF1934 family)
MSKTRKRSILIWVRQVQNSNRAEQKIEFTTQH